MFDFTKIITRTHQDTFVVDRDFLINLIRDCKAHDLSENYLEELEEFLKNC